MQTDTYRDNPTTNHPDVPGGTVVLTREIRHHYINAFNREHLQVLADAKSNGGASHVYSLRLNGCAVGAVDEAKVDGRGNVSGEVALIKFQQGPVQEVGVNGITDEGLLAVVVDRMQGFQQGSNPCRENALVITKLQEALHWLRHRAEDREARGVEGTNQR